MPERHYEGSCHCGSIGFCYTTAIDPCNWSIRACQCHFCRMHDTLSASDPDGALRFHASDPKVLQRYRFALKTADFLVCKRCGVYLGAVIGTPRGGFGIINVRALGAIPGDNAEVSAMSYDNETEQDRVSRREERWTPVTDFSYEKETD